MINSLSIIIIAGNAQGTIIDCIKSCLFATEILVIAANSSDHTIALIKKNFPRVKIITTTDEYGRNFSKWRNLGLQAASKKWLLYIDTDELVTSSLQAEIVDVINRPQPNTHYAIPRENYYLNHRVKFGGSYPDYVKRLFIRQNLKKYTGILHEEPVVSGNLGYLQSGLIHKTHTDLHSMIEKTLIWTDMEAQALFTSRHPPVVWWRFPRMMVTKLWQRLVVEQMWRDGTVGWISAIFETFDTFIIYARLWEIQHQPKY